MARVGVGVGKVTPFEWKVSGSGYVGFAAEGQAYQGFPWMVSASARREEAKVVRIVEHGP